MRTYLLMISLAMMAACEDRSENRNSQTDSIVVTAPAKPADDAGPVAGCYMGVLGRDTFAASLQQNGNIITGTLSFDNYEKDGSKGTVKGELRDNVLKLHYSFASEGMNSVMEVYFKEQDGSLVRGIGEMNTRGDTAYFVDPASIKYDGSSLKKIDCESLPAKYK